MDYFFTVVAPALQKNFIEKVDIEDLIQYELLNHECYYIGDFSLAVIALKEYFPEMPNKELIMKVKEVYDKTLCEYEKEKIDI